VSSALRWFALVVGLSAGLRAADLTVFAAASLSDALTEIGGAYAQAGGERVRFNFAASSTLARQIREGAPADAFFSADEARMDELAGHGLVVAETRRTLLANTLVLVVPVDRGGGIAQPADLATAAIRRVALAEPNTVPAGIYAKAYLSQKGLWTEVSPKVISAANVRAALAAIEAGNVDAGFVYKTDAARSTRVRIAYEVPAEDGLRIAYPVAVLRNARAPEAARRFVTYLASPEARSVFVAHGFVPATP
jgi:molybdate transport system substrate-binding protein